MKIGIVGLGSVGEAIAHVLATQAGVRHLALLNRTADIAHAVALDLRQARAWGAPLETEATGLEDVSSLEGCDLIVISAGPRLKGTQKRMELAVRSAELYQRSGLVDWLKSQGERAPLVLIVTNPVEPLVAWLWAKTALPRSRLLGLGTTVDTARYAGFLADQTGLDAASTWVPLVGEHGDELGPIGSGWSSAYGFSAQLELAMKHTKSAAREIRTLSETVGRIRAEGIVEELRNALGSSGDAATLDLAALWLSENLPGVLAPPATRFAIAAATGVVVESIRQNTGKVLTVSGPPPSSFGLPDVALALPFVLRRSGIVQCALDSGQLPEVARHAAKSIQTAVEAITSAGW